MGRLSSIIWMDSNAITIVLQREIEEDVTFAWEVVTCEVTILSQGRPRRQQN